MLAQYRAKTGILRQSTARLMLEICRETEFSAIILPMEKPFTEDEEIEQEKEREHKTGLLYVILIGAILATLPCYCSGILLVNLHQDPTPTPTLTPPPAITATLWMPSSTPTATFEPTFTPTPTNTPYVPSETMRP